MVLDSGKELKNLKVDGGMTNGDLAMSILADINGTDVIRPEMRESVVLQFYSMFGHLISLWFSGRPLLDQLSLQVRP